ncbi:unnamed protein product [Alopecurus aequalis]
MKRRFVNLVTRRYAGRWPQTEEIYSVHRVDPYTHFFYGSAGAALEAADDAAKKNELFPATQKLQLPSPVMNFADRLEMCGLLSRDRIVYANRVGDAGLYDADRHAHSTLPGLNAPKVFIFKPVCLSVPHPDANGEDRMYVLDRYPKKDACFKVLMPSMWGDSPWRWRLLPPPPFIREPVYEEPSSFPHYESEPSLTSFASVVDGNGRSTIYISDRRIGTYNFESETAKSRFFGHRRAGAGPNHLCAMDLSSAAMDREPPVVQQVWQGLPYPPEGEDWVPEEPPELVDLGDGKFLIAKFFEAVATDEHFALLTGVEMMMAGDQSIQMVMHKCARFESDSIEWVL